MPSRNIVLKASDAASRRPKATGSGPNCRPEAAPKRSSLIRHAPQNRSASEHLTGVGASLGPTAKPRISTLIHKTSFKCFGSVSLTTPERKKSRALAALEEF
jgi:hypothetical protein